MTRKTLEIAAGVVVTASLGLATAAFSWAWSMNTQVQLLQAELNHIREDKQTDQRQDAAIKSFSIYTRHLHDLLNETRVKAGLPLVATPRLD